ncbi:MAG: hypothetical protein MK117_05985 [Gemmatimonadetes bacterium]|nr:hypothetical protein [Gemmatimonadota bacterium]
MSLKKRTSHIFQTSAQGFDWFGNRTAKIGLSVGILGTPPAEGLGLRMLEDPIEAAGWALERAQVFRGS